MPKKSTTVRLTEGGQRRLEWLARRLDVPQTEVLEIALKHLHGSALRDQDPHVWDPPPPAGKGGSDAA